MLKREHLFSKLLDPQCFPTVREFFHGRPNFLDQGIFSQFRNFSTLKEIFHSQGHFYIVKEIFHKKDLLDKGNFLQITKFSTIFFFLDQGRLPQ